MNQLARALQSALTVEELIEELQQIEDKTQKVVSSYNFGDLWNSEVSKPATGCEEARVKWSDYHSMMAISDSEEDGSDDLVSVILIK